MKKQIISLAFLLACSGAYSQTSYLREISINHSNVEKIAGRQVKVTFDADLSELDMKRQQSLRIAPVLISEDGNQKVELPAFIINGKVRDKANARTKALHGATPNADALFTV